MNIGLICAVMSLPAAFLELSNYRWKPSFQRKDEDGFHDYGLYSFGFVISV